MAKYSNKVMGKEIGQASVYAEPHTMSGKKVTVQQESQYKTGKECMNEMNMSVGNVSQGRYSPINPYGVGEMRGYGAATKGRKISGKMG